MRKLLALAILLTAVIFAAPASAQTAQEFWTAEFAKANKAKRNVDPVANYFVRPTQQVVRHTARQLQPRQIEHNTRTILRAPLDATKWIFDGVDAAGQILINRKGTNFTELGCKNCGRGQREVNIATNFRDCAGGDWVPNWKLPECSSPAPAGAINAMRIWNNNAHIERVVGTCGSGHVIVADQNGDGVGNGTVRCVTIAGATYHYPLPKTGDPKVDGPFFMQKDGFCPRHLRKSA